LTPPCCAAGKRIPRWTCRLRRARRSAWAGSPINRTDRQRSCAVEQFLPLLRSSGAEFFSLQKGEHAKDLANLPKEISVRDLDPLLGDFGDLAVIVDQLDLVISVDTAAAHLAGALAKPVWTVLSAEVADWRWGLNGASTLWYPSMKLFRRETAGDWAGVFKNVAEELRSWLDKKAKAR
jgi:hypothetical protein